MTTLRIDSDRLWATLMDISVFGATPNQGLDRLTLSEADFAARDFLIAAARQREYRVAVDGIGNLFVTRPGRDDSLAPVLIGSHLDSQPAGGRFDGIYGVISGLEVLRTLDDLGLETDRAIVLVDWTNEEGSRFSPTLMGSAVFTGTLPLEEALARTDAAGVTAGEALATWHPGLDECPYRVGDFAAAFELHIEQGPQLEAEGLDIGVVTGGQGLGWYDVSITGRGGHAGTTPHASRHDALVAAAEVVLAVDALPGRTSADLRATSGRVLIHPGSRNSIPGRATVEIDLRHPDLEVLETAGRLLREECSAVTTTRGVEVSVTQCVAQSPVAFDEGVLAHVSSAAEALGLSSRRIASGAGHDSMQLAPHIPTGMIFIPCVDGISHDEAELIYPDWAANGANVLLGAVWEACRG